MGSFLEGIKRFSRHEKVARLRAQLPELNFITLHYLYFISVCLITSVIFYVSSKPNFSISYTNSLFLVVSAMTEAGLNTVNLSSMTTFQQIILWFLIIIGSSIWVSIFTVLTRKRFFETRLKDIVKRQKKARMARGWNMSEVRESNCAANQTRLDELTNVKPANNLMFEGWHFKPRDPTTEASSSALVVEKPLDPSAAGGVKKEGEDSILAWRGPVIEVEHDQEKAPNPGLIREAPQRSPILNFAGVGAHPRSTSLKFGPSESMTDKGSKRTRNEHNNNHEEEIEYWQYPHYLTRRNTSRHAQFHGLSKAEREHVGGVEYRAITLLAYVVPIYFVLWQVLGCIGLGAYMACNKASTSRENGVSPWWLGIFNGVSAFNNSGMSLLDANMIPFQTSIYTLITMGLMIIAGNTAYPLFLRLILWSMLKLFCFIYPTVDKHADHKATLRFALQYPRRVYTDLFASVPTWWLLFMLIILTSIDWAAFGLLNIGNPAIEAIPDNYRALDGLFQAISVRSGGFYIISIASLRIGLQVLYVIMMYISVYPVVITMRHSNVYEERSLGIYANDNNANDLEEGPELGSLAKRLRRTVTRQFTMPFASPTQHKDLSAHQFVRQQIRGQLAHDMWWISLAILFVSIIEFRNFDRDPITYSVFNIIFEIVSGYGCVGISTGLPNESYSFCGGWHRLSKLILIAVMLRGRHRGLPVALDRAVRLPGMNNVVGGKMEEDDRIVWSRESKHAT